MIEIDDAGTGDIVGGAFILFWRRETNDLLKKEVPLELYQSPDFNQRTQEFIQQLFIEAIVELEITKTEGIHLCTGSCFNMAREYLKAEQFNLIDAKIEGYLQDQVEQTYLNHLHETYGISSKKLTVESGKKRFFLLYNWITSDFPRRQFFVKSGFEAWQKKWKQKAEIDWQHKMIHPNKRSYKGPKRRAPAKKSYHKSKFSRTTRSRIKPHQNSNGKPTGPSE
ncbi:MAG: hypothetical protein ACTSWW_02990 [Promethearchaeota archaeon]